MSGRDSLPSGLTLCFLFFNQYSHRSTVRVEEDIFLIGLLPAGTATASNWRNATPTHDEMCRVRFFCSCLYCWLLPGTRYVVVIASVPGLRWAPSRFHNIVYGDYISISTRSTSSTFWHCVEVGMSRALLCSLWEPSGRYTVGIFSVDTSTIYWRISEKVNDASSDHDSLFYGCSLLLRRTGAACWALGKERQHQRKHRWPPQVEGHED